MFIRLSLILFVLLSVVSFGAITHAAGSEPETEIGLVLESVGPITFGPDNILFVADNQAAKIYALDVETLVSNTTLGLKNIMGIDQQIAALLGTDVREIAITDLAISPKSRNAFIALSRGRGNNAQPVLIRVDGSGQLNVISLRDVHYTMLEIPNPPQANPDSESGQFTQRRDGSWIEGRARMHSTTDMAYIDGKLFIAGLSNDEFSSKLRSVSFPFDQANEGTSVEIWHAAHGQFETQSPVYTFVPYRLNGEQNLIAGYLCTPLVKFSISDLKPGNKVMGQTIAELGNGNRPLDMIVYHKNGSDYLLMSNTSRGVMKIPTDGFSSANEIDEAVARGETAGIEYETITKMSGVEQLDLFDTEHAIVIKRNDVGVANLEIISLP